MLIRSKLHWSTHKWQTKCLDWDNKGHVFGSGKRSVRPAELGEVFSVSIIQNACPLTPSTAFGPSRIEIGTSTRRNDPFLDQVELLLSQRECH